MNTVLTRQVSRLGPRVLSIQGVPSLHLWICRLSMTDNLVSFLLSLVRAYWAVLWGSSFILICYSFIFNGKNPVSQGFCQSSGAFNWMQKARIFLSLRFFSRQLWLDFTNEHISDKKANSRLFVPQPTSWAHTSRYCSCLKRVFCMNNYHLPFLHSSGKPWQVSFSHRVELSCKIRFHWHRNTATASTMCVWVFILLLKFFPRFNEEAEVTPEQARQSRLLMRALV